MKPVMQTNTDSVQGNCMTACLASIFELPIEEVPNWAEQFKDDAEMWEAYCQWLWDRGYQNVVLRGSAIETIGGIKVGESVGTKGFMVDGWGSTPVRLGGASPRGAWGHTCVGQFTHAGMNLKIIHDPHPDQTGLKKLETIELLVPILKDIKF